MYLFTASDHSTNPRLLEYLLKKYPFRVIPGLPPKKFSGTYQRASAQGHILILQ